MHENKPPAGNLALPEFKTLPQAFQTLLDRANTSGQPQMASFVIRENLMGIMVIGPAMNMHALSRIISTIGQTPLVGIPGQ